MSNSTRISTTLAAAPSASYSQGFELDTLVVTGGQVGASPEGTLGANLAEQVDLAINNLERVLEAGGSSLPQVVKTTCYLANAEDFSEFDKLYRQRFKDPLPARSTVAVAFGAKGILVEIEAIATK